MSDEGITKVMGGQDLTLRIFGHGITDDTVIAFTQYFTGDEHSTICQILSTKVFKVLPGSVNFGSALVEVQVGLVDEQYFMCARQSSGENHVWQFQGKDTWMQIIVHKPLLPLWLTLCIIGTCLLFSALFSGLNLGLMSLDRTDLKVSTSNIEPYTSQNASLWNFISWHFKMF